MSQKVKTIEINAVDNYGECLEDSVNREVKQDRVKPKGYVEIYEVGDDGSKTKLHGRNNLVLYLGREFLAQKLVNKENGLVAPTKDEYIGWFGVGNGGVVPADPFTPLPPDINDQQLGNQVILIDTTAVGYTDFHEDTEPGYDETGYYKKVIVPEEIEFEEDDLNDDRYLVIKIAFTVGTEDSNGKQISEAGLFTAENDNGPFHLFAKVTYPSIVKTEDRRLLFRWYLYV